MKTREQIQRDSKLEKLHREINALKHHVSQTKEVNVKKVIAMDNAIKIAGHISTIIQRNQPPKPNAVSKVIEEL